MTEDRVAERLREAILGGLAQRIAKARALCPIDPDDLSIDSDIRDLVSFNLLLAVQACLDLATDLIADESWEPAATTREAFERLHEKGVLSKETLLALRNTVGLYNVVAYDYANVDPARIHTTATSGLADLERFAQELVAWTRTA